MPPVQIFIFANVNELANSPVKNPSIDATTTLGALPKTVTQAFWFGQLGSAGISSTTRLMTAANARAANPAHTTRLDRAYP